jgi:hypothetical protein
VKAAVERERVAWRRKLEQGRARYRQMVAAATSAGQSFDKLKVLLEKTEREWAKPTSYGRRYLHTLRLRNLSAGDQKLIPYLKCRSPLDAASEPA